MRKRLVKKTARFTDFGTRRSMSDLTRRAIESCLAPFPFSLDLPLPPVDANSSFVDMLRQVLAAEGEAPALLVGDGYKFGFGTMCHQIQMIPDVHVGGRRVDWPPHCVVMIDHQHDFVKMSDVISKGAADNAARFSEFLDTFKCGSPLRDGVEDVR